MINGVLTEQEWARLSAQAFAGSYVAAAALLERLELDAELLGLNRR